MIGREGQIPVLDEEKAPLVKRMFELYATGNYSLEKFVEVMYKEGLRTKKGNKLVKSRMASLLAQNFIGKIRTSKNELKNRGKIPCLFCLADKMERF